MPSAVYKWGYQAMDNFAERCGRNAGGGTGGERAAAKSTAPAGLALAPVAPAGPVAEGAELQTPTLATHESTQAPTISSGGWNAVEGSAASPRVPTSPRHLPNRPTAAIVSSSASPHRLSTNGGAAGSGSGQLPRMLLQPMETFSPAASAPLPKLLSPPVAAAIVGPGAGSSSGPLQQELPPPPAMLPGMSHRRSVEMAAQQQMMGVAPPPSLLVALVASALDSGSHAVTTPQSPAATAAAAARYGTTPHSGSLAVASPARLSAAVAPAAATTAGSYSQCASPLACASGGSFAAPETIRVSLLPTGSGLGHGVGNGVSFSGSGGGGSGPNSAVHLAAVPPTSAASRAVGSSSALQPPARLSVNGGTTGAGGGGWLSPTTAGAYGAVTSASGASGALQQRAAPSPLGVSSLSCTSAPLPPPLLLAPASGAAGAAHGSSGGGGDGGSVDSSLAPPQQQLLPPPLPPAGRPRNPRASVDAAAGALELPEVDGDTAAAANAAADAAAASARAAGGFAPPQPLPRANSPAAAAVAAAAASRPPADGRVSNGGSAGASGSGSSPRNVLRSDTPPKQIWSQAQQRGPAKPAIKKSNLSNVAGSQLSPSAASATAVAASTAPGGSIDAAPVSALGPASAASTKQQQRVVLSTGGGAGAAHAPQQDEEPDRLLDLEPPSDGGAAGEGGEGGEGEAQPWFDENMQRARNQARLAALELAEEVRYVAIQEARGSGSGHGKSGARRRRGGSRDARGSGSCELEAAEGGSRRCESESGAAAGHRTIRGGNRSRVHTASGAGGAAAVVASDASVGSPGGTDPGLVRRRTFGEVFDHGDEEDARGSGGPGAGGGGRKGGRRKGAPQKSASALAVAWRAFTSLAAKAIGGGGGGRVGAWGGGGGGGGDDSDGAEEPLPVQRSRDSRALHRKRLGLDGTQTAPAAWLRQHQQQQQQLQPQAAGGSSTASPMAKSPMRMNSNDPINAAVVAAAMEFLVARSAASAVGHPVARDRTPQASPLPVQAAATAAAAAAAAGVVGA